LTVKSLEELAEVLLGVVGAGRRLGMVLDGENRGFSVSDAFYGAVIEVKVRDLKCLRTWDTAGIAPDGESVVLGGDKHLPCREITNRVVSSPMSIGELYRVASERESQQLMAEADAENGKRPIGEFADRVDRIPHRCRIPWSIREEQPVGGELAHSGGRRRGRNDGDAAAVLHE
jgi:hypothetical protein